MNRVTLSEPDQKTTERKGEPVDAAAAQLRKIRRAGISIGKDVGSFVREKPIAAVGIAVGAGFVLGSVFGSRLGRIALVAAAGYVAQDLIEDALGEGGVRKILVDEVSKLAKLDRAAS